ncbi:trypsin [Lachnospiraceae bacterium oral taxon 082 str. F0431]|nr:trypsin [Lachnospiraceae bacterium oral taxon 082 str. F0431]
MRISLASIRRKDRDKKETKTEASAANSHISNTGGAAKTAVASADTNMPRSGIKTDRELSYIELAKLSTSIVMIAVYDNRQKMLGTGSGIMIGKDGFILTNNHVIRGGYYFEVRIEDDERIYKTDEVIKYNQYLDLAIIRIARVLSPLRLFDGREKLVRGQNVVAIGSPLGLFNSVSDGIISGFRNIDNVDMIQFSAPISPGSSGGAVLNMFGEVIGISTAGFSEGQNINLAVPYDAIYGFAKSFIR